MEAPADSCRIGSLLVITSNYPAPDSANSGTFVEQIVHAVAARGVDVTVVHPISRFRRGVSEETWEEPEKQERGVVRIIRPRYLPIPTRDRLASLGPLGPNRLQLASFQRAVFRAVRNYRLQSHAVYGHFLSLAGLTAVRLGTLLGIPAFPALGESVCEGSGLWSIRRYSRAFVREAIRGYGGIIVNSVLLCQILQGELDIPRADMIVLPNGVDLTRFQPMEKRRAREMLGLDQREFLVGCTGKYSHRKGQARLLHAINGVDGVRAILPGCRRIELQRWPGKLIAFASTVRHERIPLILSACDAFVLPTMAEGSSNAIIEAMACGLPIISSVGEFNDDLLTSDMAIRVDPLDVKAIREAIVTLRDNPVLRTAMAHAAHRRSRLFDADDRAQRMLEFMETRVGMPNRAVRADDRLQ